MPYGYVTRFDEERGFGFVLEDGEAEEIEFHSSAVIGDMRDLVGQRVTFDKRIDHRDQSRMRALNVRLLEGPGRLMN